MYYVYVLRSKIDKKLYVGHTQDIPERLQRHNSGGVNSTKNRKPFDLIYSETYYDRSAARWREKFFKTAWGKKKLYGLLEKK